MKKIISALVLTVGMVFSAIVSAGGPLQVNNSNQPIVYPAGGANITLNYDQGPLGSRTNAQADALLNTALSLWNNVATSTLTLSQGTDLPGDVTLTNSFNLEDNYNDGINPIVYDNDGTITDAIFGVGAKNFVLGFAGSAHNGTQYTEGDAVINGFISISNAELTNVLTHEIGHFFGLDHTQLDNTQGLSRSNYPMMYPIAFRTNSGLHNDDVAAVSALYPSASFNTTYGTLTGSFHQADGTPIRGANIWAKKAFSPSFGQVFSTVSDYLKTNSGDFTLTLPPATYEIYAESIQSDFNEGSSVGPYAETPTDISFQAPHPISTIQYGSTEFTTYQRVTVTAGNSINIDFNQNGVIDTDGDGINIGRDRCRNGETGWTSNATTDYDSDGCRDATEDLDDDNDGVIDENDSCPLGELLWLRSTSTDTDNDGCRDATEDLDDDNDGLSDVFEINGGLDPYDALGDNGPSGDPDGDGFTNLEEFTAGSYPGSYVDVGSETDSTSSLVLGDIDGDGDLDLLVGNTASTNMLYRNDGSGNFSATGTPIGSDTDITFSIAAGDIDGDGDLDLLAGNSQANKLYLNDGSGNFSITGIPVGSETDFTNSLILGDIDNDGDLDLLTGNNGGVTNKFYLNDGSGGFSATGVSIGNEIGFTQSIVAGDVDGDGDLDMLAGNADGETNKLFLNNGNGFYSDTAIPVGNDTLDNTQSLILHDVDSDGDLDLLTGNYGRTNKLYLNDGSGNFSATGISIGSETDTTFTLALGDIDGDGDPDLLAGSFNMTTKLYRNDGTGGFDVTGTNISNNIDWTESLVLGDVDGDGDLDLFEGNLTRTNKLYLNDGDGDFSSGATSSPGFISFSNTSYNVVENAGSASISVTRSGSVGPASAICVSSGSTATAGVDYSEVNQTLTWLDGDGGIKTCTVPIISDAEVESAETIVLTLALLSGNAKLDFPFSVATLTINDDNDLDGIIDANDNCPGVANAGQENNDGDTQGDVCDADDDNDTLTDIFEAANSLDPFDATGDNGAAGDADGDGFTNLEEQTAGTDASAATGALINPGFLDFSAASSSVDEAIGTSAMVVTRTGGSVGAVSVNCFTNDSAVATTATSVDDYTSLGVGTLLNWTDGDATSKDCDITIIDDADVETSEDIQVDLSSPSGGAKLGTLNTTLLTITDNDAAPPAKAINDFNGDLKSDIPLYRSDNGGVRVWEMDGGNITANTFSGALGTNFAIAGFADTNADGNADIIWFDANTGAIRIWLMNGGTVTSDIGVGSLANPWVPVEIGDFNNDNQADILWHRPDTGDVRIWLLDNGTLQSNNYISALPTSWEIRGLADVNNDGQQDIVWRNANNSDIRIWQMSGATLTANGYVGGFANTDWTTSGLGDFNNDGNDDILFTNTNNGAVRIWEMNGVTRQADRFVSVFPTAWKVQNIGDYNNDGTDDILWQHSTNGGMRLWPMANSNLTANTFIGTYNDTDWKLKGHGDYDGGGTIDILWQNPTTGSVRMWLMDGDTVTGNLFVGLITPFIVQP